MSEIQISRIQKLSTRNKLAFSISILSFLILFPGIYLPMLSISNEGELRAKVPRLESNFLGIPSIQGTETRHMEIDIFDTTRSTLKMIYDLWEKKYHFVSSMILLFSVIIPILKGGLLTYIFFTKNQKIRNNIFTFIKSIGKWSMCDVFVVAILLVYLSTGGAETQNVSNVTIMGYTVKVHTLVGMQAQLEIGFWFFLSYCLLSLLALQLYKSY